MRRHWGKRRIFIRTNQGSIIQRVIGIPRRFLVLTDQLFPPGCPSTIGYLLFVRSFASSLGENTITEESADNVLFTRTRHGSDRNGVGTNKRLFLLRRVMLSNRKGNRSDGFSEDCFKHYSKIRNRKSTVESWTKAAVLFQRRQNWSRKFFRQTPTLACHGSIQQFSNRIERVYFIGARSFRFFLVSYIVLRLAVRRAHFRKWVGWRRAEKIIDSSIGKQRILSFANPLASARFEIDVHF